MKYLRTGTDAAKSGLTEIETLIEQSIREQVKFLRKLKGKKTKILLRKDITQFFQKKAKDDEAVKRKFRKLFKEHSVVKQKTLSMEN